MITIHTHFGSATFSVSAFLSVALMGTAWRLGWLHVLAWGRKRGNKHAEGLARAGLFQY